MGKNLEYKNMLRPLIDHRGQRQELETYLINNSNLPGPRGNLELAFAFADLCAELTPSQADLELLHRWLTISEKEAEANDPMMFLPFCALVALGAIYPNIDKTRQNDIISRLQTSANDGRWRIREAVAMGFQRIAEKDVSVIVNTFSTWIDDATLTEHRAILAALAHPPILHNANTVRFGLHVSGKILAGVKQLTPAKRKQEDFRILKKGLAFTISVFVAHLPDEGFPFMLKWAVDTDKDIRWILKSNLNKNRLAKPYPSQVKEILSMLT